MGRIYEVCRSYGLSCYNVHTKIYKYWFRRSEVDRGRSHKPTSGKRLKTSPLPVVSYGWGAIAASEEPRLKVSEIEEQKMGGKYKSHSDARNNGRETQSEHLNRRGHFAEALLRHRWRDNKYCSVIEQCGQPCTRWYRRTVTMSILGSGVQSCCSDLSVVSEGRQSCQVSVQLCSITFSCYIFRTVNI
jgi:hypothetical protein